MKQSCRILLIVFAISATQFSVSYAQPFVFDPPLTFAAGPTPIWIATGDLNGDGALDIVVASDTANIINVLLGDGHGSFAPGVPIVVGVGFNNPISVAVADFNEDGALDLAVGKNNINNLAILLGDGLGNFGPFTDRVFENSIPEWLTAVNVNHDSHVDLVFANRGTGTAGVVLGNGDATFGALRSYPVTAPNDPLPGFSEPTAIAVGDFNHDGHVDLAVTLRVRAHVAILLGDGTGGFSLPIIVPFGDPLSTVLGASAVAAADYDGDGHLDLAVTARFSDAIFLLRGNGAGGFVQEQIIHTGIPIRADFADLNADGFLDLVWAIGSNNGQLAVARGLGGEGISTNPTVFPGIGGSPTFLIATNVNDDGVLDIVTANYVGNVSVLLNRSVVQQRVVTNCTTYGSSETEGDLAWALQGGGTVTFACSGTIIVPEIVITTDTVIDGTGQTVVLSGNNANRVFYVSDGARLDLVHLTVTGGNGGGLFARMYSTVNLTDTTVSGNTAFQGAGLVCDTFATVTLTNSTVSGNSAELLAGIWANSCTVTLTNSTVSGNTAAAHAGVAAVEYSSVTLTNSTVSGNSATYAGGGVSVFLSAVTLTNSTVSGNTAEEWGGGLYAANSSTVTLTNSTVTDNSAAYGAGVYATESARVTLMNSIVATQVHGADCFVEPGVSIASAGYSLDSDGTCGLTGAGDQPGAHPRLGPLQDNGGPTWTHALRSGSPAIDAIPAGTNGCGDTAQTDQRGVTRPQGAACDIGAFEVVVNTGAAEQINDLIDLVQSFNLTPGTENSLVAKLQDTLAALGKKNLQPACSSLQDFINETTAQTGKTISASQASEMVGAANQIKAVLGCR